MSRTEPRGDVDRQVHDSCFRIAEKAGALCFCRNGHATIYRPFDDRAEAKAFAEVAAAHNDGALSGYRLDVVFAELCRILDEADRSCPACAA